MSIHIVWLFQWHVSCKGTELYVLFLTKKVLDSDFQIVFFKNWSLHHVTYCTLLYCTGSWGRIQNGGVLFIMDPCEVLPWSAKQDNKGVWDWDPVSGDVRKHRQKYLQSRQHCKTHSIRLGLWAKHTVCNFCYIFLGQVKKDAAYFIWSTRINSCLNNKNKTKFAITEKKTLQKWWNTFSKEWLQMVLICNWWFVQVWLPWREGSQGMCPRNCE